MNLFSIKENWNKAISTETTRPMVKRNHLWASEITQPLVDLWLKMNEVEPTNRPDERAIRKFTAGNVTEASVASILRASGANITQQVPAELIISNTRITGKIDLLYTGKTTPSFDHEIQDLKNIAQKFESLPECSPTIIEIKSLGTFAFQRLEATGKPMDSHVLQAYVYAKSKQIPAILCCISRDDLRIEEFVIPISDKILDKKLEEKVKAVEKALESTTPPPKEPLILFDEYGFSLNFGVIYSNYLTLLYGFGHSEEYRSAVEPLVKSLQKALKEKVSGKTFKTKKAQDSQIERFNTLEKYLEENAITPNWETLKANLTKIPDEESEE